MLYSLIPQLGERYCDICVGGLGCMLSVEEGFSLLLVRNCKVSSWQVQ